MSKFDGIVLAWYRRDDYPKIYALAPDGGKMEPTFDQWIKVARALLPTLKSQGKFIKKIYINPDELASWLRATNNKSTPETRALFVRYLYEKRHVAH